MRKNKWMSFNFISIRYNYSLHTYGNRKYGESPLPPFDVMFLQSERSSKTFAIDFTHIWFGSSGSSESHQNPGLCSFYSCSISCFNAFLASCLRRRILLSSHSFQWASTSSLRFRSSASHASCSFHAFLTFLTLADSRISSNTFFGIMARPNLRPNTRTKN